MISKIHNTEVFGKAFCLTMVHTGVNKMLSNLAINDNDETAIKGEFSNYVI